jgi:hypothetical protein
MIYSWIYFIYPIGCMRYSFPGNVLSVPRGD